MLYDDGGGSTQSGCGGFPVGWGLMRKGEMLFVAPIAGEPRGRSVRGSVVGELVGFDDTFGRGAAVIREVCDLGEEIDGGGWVGVHDFFAWWWG